MAQMTKWLAVLALLGPGIAACDALASADPENHEFASDDSKQAVEALIQAWFTLIEDPNADPSALGGLLSETSFELSLVDAALRSHDELRAWVSSLRVTYPHLEYRLGSIHIESVGPGLYRALFEFDRQATDGDGLPHVARREHRWIVREGSNQALALLEIEARPLIYFSGTGPKLVCY